MMDKLKDYAAVAAIVLVIGAAYMEWRIATIVDTKLASQDIGTDSKIVSMDVDIAANGAGVTKNEENIEKAEQTLRDVAAILMGD